MSTWAHRYTLFLCFGTSDFPKSTPKPGVLFSSDWDGAHYLSVNDLTASKVAGPGTRERADFAVLHAASLFEFLIFFGFCDF